MKYMKNCKGLFGFWLLLVPMASGASVLFSLGLEPLINVAAVKEEAHFARYLLLELLFAIADLSAHYFQKICRERLRYFYVTGLKRDCFDAIMDRRVSDFYEQPVSAYMSVLNRDVDKLSLNVFDSACGFYRVAVGFGIHLYAVFRVNPYLVVMNVAFSFASACIPRFFEKRLIAAQNESSRRSAEYYAGLNDCFNGFATIKTFNVSAVMRERQERANRRLEEANYRSTGKNYGVSCISMLCTNIGYVLTIGAGVYFTLIGKMTVGQVIAVSQLMGGLAVPFEELPALIANYKSVADVRQKLLTLIKSCSGEGCEGDDYEDESFEDGNCSDESREDLDEPLKAIELKNVSFRFEKQEKGFEKLSYVFEAGRKYIMLGESGSGKSTLAKLLSDFYRCDTGQITINHRNIRKLSEASLYRYINYIEQRVFLFNDTLRSNITMYREYPQTEIEKAVRLAGLKALVERLSEGLETRIEGNGVNFSGGELQRIAIARAILAKAQFIIFDEVTANMDSALAAEMERGILQLEHTGVLYITHKCSRELLEAGDRIIIMKDWRILTERDYSE
ncbi:MAG: ABC transporter ATP-binding protein/permease [Roseburia sp.]|nr:ABC transporter ATP-binding protein/permease [Roseburia sp.]